MRFAYIDSQGNEVQVPSEDALRLRIELGAIVESTSFFDGEGAGWAPARDHEVYRRLKRDLEGVTDPDPLPVSDIGPDEEPRMPAPTPQPEDDWAGMELGDGGGFERMVDFDAAPEADEGGDDFGIEGLEGFGGLELQDPAVPEPRASAPAPESPMPSDDDATRLPEPGVEVDDPWTVPGRDPWAPEVEEPMERPSSMESVGFGDEPAPAPDAPHPFDADEEMPDWLRNDPEFGSSSAEAPAPDRPAASFPTREEVRERYEHEVQRTAPAGRSPSPPPVPRPGGRSSRVRPVALGLVGVLVVAGGWYFTRGFGNDPGADTAVVELPAISPTLLPVATEAANRANLATVAAMRDIPAREAIPDEPDADWLAGSYMASASDYTPVRLYWEAMGRYVQVMRAREGEMFEAELAAALDTVPLAPDDRAEVEARSVAGFAAAAPERDAVYAQLRAVADAALRLHFFLEQNQEQIDYEPVASGLSRDPVLEAVPVTAELGEEMWNRVAEITSALDALGFLDKVTTDQLLAVFFDKLEAVPVR